jgi:acyl-CoA synthetase (AMP-forming)/AMP-acid ligase II
MSDPSAELHEKIHHARSLDAAAADQPMVPFRNFGALLAERTDEQEDKPFLVYYGEESPRKEFSYREIFEEVHRTANFLKASGIQKGDRIATVSHNHYDTVAQYFAAFLLGAVAVPVNVGEDDRRIRYVLENSGTKLAFVRDQYLPRIQEIAPGLPLRIIQTGRKTDPSLPHAGTEISKQPPRCDPVQQPALDDDALIVYTSGTTGNPKGVVLSQYNLLVDAMGIAEWHQIADDQKMMCVLPIHHVNGIVVTLITPLYAGAGTVLNQKFHSERFFERISAERVAVVSVVPTLLQFLLHARLDMEAYKLAPFRHIICGAGPLTVDLAQKFEQTFKIPIIHGYGLSETTCYSCFLPIDLSAADHRRWMKKFGFPSIGVPLPVNDMAIHDGEGRELGEGERGEIVIRGHNVMKGYFQDTGANAEAYTHGWFRSGDEGFFRYDDEGRRFFFITGRIKELIIRGGANISPFEIDEVLMHIPGVETGIAVGFENEWYGEEVGAYIKLKPEMQITGEDILKHCRKALPFAKSPKTVVFGEEVPVNSTGKYQRTKLKELFASWKSVQFHENR